MANTKKNGKTAGTLVEQLMNQPAFCCGIDDSLNVAAQLMWENDCGFVPVVDHEGRAAGVVTDRDLCMAAYTKGSALSQIPVRSIMSGAVHVCAPGDSLADAEKLMREKQIRRIPVVDAEMRPLGVVSLSDIARFGGPGAKRSRLQQEVVETFATICSPRHEAMAPTSDSGSEAQPTAL